MLNDKIRTILASARETGWVLEPEAKRLLALAGLKVPRFTLATTPEEALQFATEIGYPLAAKVVSPKILHKSDVAGVAVGIESEEILEGAFHRFSALEGFSGMLVEEMVSGLELIIGAKIDYQFGPVILLGMGGTGVEIYKDATMRMAPLKESDVRSMITGLKAHQLLEGFRGRPPIGMEALTRTLLDFSDLVMDVSDKIESADLNPVMCTADACIVADARILLQNKGKK